MQATDQQAIDIHERIADAEAEVARAQAHLEALRRSSQQDSCAAADDCIVVTPDVRDPLTALEDEAGTADSFSVGQPIHSDVVSSPDAIVDAIAAESEAESLAERSGSALTVTYEGAPFVPAKDHVAAGLLAITLGCLGIHKFYLGYLTSGFIMLGISIVGGVLTLGIATVVVAVIGIVEGILYLAESQSKFESTHVTHVREWF